MNLSLVNAVINEKRPDGIRSTVTKYKPIERDDVLRGTILINKASCKRMH